MRMGIEQLSRVENSAPTGFPSGIVGLKEHNTNHWAIAEKLYSHYWSDKLCVFGGEAENLVHGLF